MLITQRSLARDASLVVLRHAYKRVSTIFSRLCLNSGEKDNRREVASHVRMVLHDHVNAAQQSASILECINVQSFSGTMLCMQVLDSRNDAKDALKIEPDEDRVHNPLHSTACI